MRYINASKTLPHGLVGVAFVALFWAFYAPPAHWPGLTFFGRGQDPLAFIWFLNWWPFAWQHHLNPFFTHYVAAPAGVDLVWKTSVPALAWLAAPVTASSGAVVSYNLLMILAAPSAGFGLYLAAYELTGGFAPAVCAGLLFAVSSYEIGQSQAHLNLAFCAAVPICLWVLLRAARRSWPRWRLGLVLGLLLTWQWGVSQEVFASLVLAGAASLAVLAWHLPGLRGKICALLPGIFFALLLFVLLAAPFLWRMLVWYRAEQQNLSAPDMYVDDLLGFVIPTPRQLFGGRIAEPLSALFSGNYAEQGGYFGLPLLLLLGWIGCAGGRQARSIARLAALAAVLSLGPHLHVLGVPGVPAPWRLVSTLPFLRGILPCRLVLYAWAASALLIALWLAQTRSWRRYAVFCLCLASIAPAQSVCRSWTQLAVPGVFARLPAGARVLVLPQFGQEMGWQYAAHMNFVLVGQGYLGTGSPAPFNTWKLFAALHENRLAAIDPARFATYLATYGVQSVVLLPRGYDFYSPQDNDAADFAAAQGLLRKAGWAPAVTTPDAMLYRLSPAAGQQPHF